MSNQNSISLLVALTLTLSASAYAAPTTYTINRTVGASATVTGTISTDGTSGTLQAQNILDWDLILNADSDAASVGHLRGPLSGGNSQWTFFPIDALYTAYVGQQNTLFFNFGATDYQVAQISTGDRSTVWQLQAGIPMQDELIRESAAVSWQPIQAFQFHGPAIMSLGTVSAVPEPSSVALLALGGLVLLGAGRLRRSGQ